MKAQLYTDPTYPVVPSLLAHGVLRNPTIPELDQGLAVVQLRLQLPLSSRTHLRGHKHIELMGDSS